MSNARSGDQAADQAAEQSRAERDPLDDVFQGLKPRKRPSPAVAMRTFNAVHTEWKRQRRRRYVQYGSLAATVLFGAVLGTTFLSSPDEVCIDVAAGGSLHVEGLDRLMTSGRACMDGNTTMVVEGTTRLVVQDTIDVRLREGSRLTWSGPQRVKLEGGAMYVNTHGHSGLFIETGFGTIRDIGTVFSADVDDDRLVVSLHEGSVEIDSARGRHLSTAQPGRGERVTVDPERVIAQTQHGIDAQLDWIFEASPGYSERRADAVLDHIARDMHMTLQYASPELKSRAESTELEGNLGHLGPREALTVVSGVCDFKVKEQGGVLVVAGSAEERGR